MWVGLQIYDKSSKIVTYYGIQRFTETLQQQIAITGYVNSPLWAEKESKE